MSRLPTVSVLQAGHCHHPEHVVLRSRRLTPMRFPALFALIEHPKAGVVLFDTGYSQHFEAATRRFPDRLYAWITPVTLPPGDAAKAQLATRGITAEDVAWVIASHFHADHVSGLADFPRARYVFFQSAWAEVRGRRGLAAVRRGFLPTLVPGDFEARAHPLGPGDLQPAPPALFPIRRGVDLFGDSTTWAVHLPGHAVGQLGLYVTADDGRDYLFVADACWTREGWQSQRLPHPVTRLLFADWGEYAATLGAIAEIAQARPQMAIVPSHCEATFATLAQAAPR